METGARERLDAAILCSLGERRAYREHRASPSMVWDRLEASVTSAATVLWEMPEVLATGDLPPPTASRRTCPFSPTSRAA